MFTVIILLTARELTFLLTESRKAMLSHLRKTARRARSSSRLLRLNASKAAPTWLDVNKDNQTAKVLRMPVKEDLDYDIEEHLIVELYSK